jgi:protein ImuB
MLWLALEFHALALQLVERAGPGAGPLVVAEGPAQRPVVACANEAALVAGVREGQAVAAARALAGELRVLERNPAAEREALESIAAWASQFTPMACIEPQGLVLEIASSLRLFGGHARLTAAIRKGVRELGYQAAMGVAPTPLAARLFARAEAQGRAVRGCIEQGELAARAAELPLFLLDWPAEVLARLTDLGLLRVRDITALPAEGLARRFGPQVALDLERLLGRVADPRLPYKPPERFRSRIELPADVEGVEALLFPLKRLLVQLEGAMRGRGAGVQHLVLWLEHGRNASTRLDLDFASPERESDFILGIAREKLGRLTLPAATCALDLRADALLPYTPRLGTWLPGEREQAIGRERLLERLAARLGKDKVFGLALADDHRPEKDWKAVENWAPGHSAHSRAPGVARSRHPGEGRGPSSPRPAWLLPRPHKLVSRDGRPTLQGELELRAGPERIEAGWWDGNEARRDYFVAANPRGETFWIYREHRDPSAWYLHGVFA